MNTHIRFLRKVILISIFNFFFCTIIIAQNTSSVKQSTSFKNTDKISYIENKGQWDKKVGFLSRSKGLDGWVLTDGSMLLDFYTVEKDKNISPDSFNKEPEGQYKNALKKGHRVLIKWVNGSSISYFDKTEKEETYYNYFIGTDTSKHARNVGLYNKVKGKNIYKGIDLKYYHQDGSMRYDIIVHPNANPSQIKLKIEGSDEVKLGENGSVVISTSIGDIRMQDLYVYEQETKKQIVCKWILNKNELTLSLGSYNKNNTLIIDPLIYSTYVGGNIDEYSSDVAADNSGNAYITGTTQSTNFDLTTGAYQTSFDGMWDVFVSKLNPLGTSLLYSTYVGGSAAEHCRSIKVDSNGNAYIAGYTNSSDYDVTVGAFQATSGGGGNGDVFITKLNTTGTALIYSTYIGGSSDDQAYGIALDAFNNAYVTGWTISPDYDVTPGAYQLTGDPVWYDAFVTKLNSSGSALIYSTYLGGNYVDQAIAIAVDNYGNAYITGNTFSNDFDVTPGAYQPTYASPIPGDGCDAFVTKINPTGTSLIYSTYLGGNSFDWGKAIAVDAVGNAFIAGETESSNFDTTAGAFQTVFGSSSSSYADAFVTKMNPTGTSLIYSTYIGGISAEIGSDIYIDPFGAAYVGGASYSLDYPVTSGSYQSIKDGLWDVVVTKLHADGATIDYSTFIGGTSWEYAYGIAADTVGGVYLSGQTQSIDYDTTAGAYQTIFSDPAYTDAFVTKIEICPTVGFALTSVNSCYGANNGSAIAIASGGIGPFSYSWSNGQFNDSISSLAPGTYIVTATNGNGCVGMDSVIIAEIPDINASISGLDSVCIWQSITLNAIGAGTYLWNTGDTTSSVTYSPNVTTSYSVIITNGVCVDTANTTIVIPVYVVNISGADSICLGEGLTLTANGGGTYNWNTGEVSTSIFVNPISDSIYSVVVNNGGCLDTTTTSIVVKPLPVTTISNDTTITLGSSANINATGGVSYSWMPLTGLSCSTCPNPTASPQSTTTYSVTITGINGCPVIETVTLTIDDNFEIFVPDIFSPNGDNQNDILYVRGPGIKELNFIIYDRLGEKIFESDKVTQGWDGTYKGKPLNDAVFVYYISATMINDEIIKLKGDITLVR